MTGSLTDLPVVAVEHNGRTIHVERGLYHHIIAGFLEKSGQWLTNEATQGAAFDRERAAERERCIAACRVVFEEAYTLSNSEAQDAAGDCIDAIRALGQHPASASDSEGGEPA